MTDKTADTVADELLRRLERLRVTESERALLRAVLALAFSEGVGVGIERVQRAFNEAGKAA